MKGEFPFKHINSQRKLHTIFLTSQSFHWGGKGPLSACMKGLSQLYASPGSRRTINKKSFISRGISYATTAEPTGEGPFQDYYLPSSERDVHCSAALLEKVSCRKISTSTAWAYFYRGTMNANQQTVRGGKEIRRPEKDLHPECLSTGGKVLCIWEIHV